jgi:hypothetical protein
MRPTRPTVRAVLAVAALVAAAAVPTAIAGVTVYKNNLSRKSDARELRHADGKHCKREFLKQAGRLRIDVTRGPELCGYRPPVEGDTDGPDHSLQAKVKFLRETPKRIRDGAYAAVAVRSGKSSGYELRVFPVKHRFRLVRSPSGGGSEFPATGKSDAIKGFNKPNVLLLKAVGSKVIAAVNGTKIVKATDSNPAQVGGRKLELGIGHGKRSKKDVAGTIDSLKVQVPTP